MADVLIEGEEVRNASGTLLLTGADRVVSAETEEVYNAAGTLLLVGELMATGVGTGGGGDEGLLASIDFSDGAVIDTFARASAAGYTGSGDANDYQREAAVDAIRNAHFEGDEECILLEDDPTPCALIAPANVVISEDDPVQGDFTATFDAVVGDVLRYEWRLDNTGSWTSLALLTSIAATGGGGEHELNIRAVSPSGVAGTATAEEFTLTGVTMIASDNFNSYSNESLLSSQSGWANVSGAMTIVKPASDGGTFGVSQAMCRSTATYGADQRSVATCRILTPGSFEFVTVGVRCQSGSNTRYHFQTDGTSWYLVATISGTQTTLTNGTHSITSGARIALEATGAGSATRLTAQVHTGGSWSNVTGVVSYDPSAVAYIDGGTPGIGHDGPNPAAALGDDWEGWNL